VCVYIYTHTHIYIYIYIHATALYYGSIMFVRCVTRNVPCGNQGNGGGDTYWSKLSSSPIHFGVYLDAIPWTMQMEGARNSETTVSFPKEL